MDNQQRNNSLKNNIKDIIKLYKNGYSQQQLGKLYNCNNSLIRYHLIRNNIKIRNLKQSKFKDRKTKKIKIDKFLHENLLGWILGDGGLRLSKKASNPYFMYTDKKQDHILYVQNILKKYDIKSNITLNKNSNCYQLQSESLKQFHKYYNLFYGYDGLNENNQKRKILPNIKITKRILLNWYIGDGSVKKSNGKNYGGQISCKYVNEYISTQLKKLFGTTFFKYKTKTSQCYTYYINSTNFKKFLKYIGECPVESYKYKWETVRRSTTIIEPSN